MHIESKAEGLNGSAPIGRGTFSMDAAAYTKAMMRRKPIGILITAVVCASMAAFVLAGSAKAPPLSNITLLRTPREGIQPQTVLDRKGVLHMIYFKGNASAGDIEYVWRNPNGKDFFQPIRVKLQRDLMRHTEGGDGGISVAADLRGDVYAVWHALGSEPGEDHRRVYLARSTDDGKTFAREAPISPAELGACGCCGMRAFSDERGTLYVFYRAAAQSIHRDMTLLLSDDRGSTFRSVDVGPWELNACPMSTAYLSEGGQRVLAAWEKAGEVYFNEINPSSFKLSPSIAAPGDGTNRKHPAVAASVNGQMLLVWTEGTGWAKGGLLAWQLFDSGGKPTGAEGNAPGIPVWGLPSVFADHQGNFTIVY